MTHHSGNSLREYFRRNARDLTPENLKDHARVFYLPVSGQSGITRQCLEVLSSREQERAGRITLPAHRVSFIERRAFRRYCGSVAFNSERRLSESEFVETESGRPLLAGQPLLWFSFSSCVSGMLGAWSSTHDIGVDIEDTTQDYGAADLARQYFSAAEARSVDGVDSRKNRQNFFGLWCLKEAALKSVGQGLPYGLDRFRFELDPRLRAVHTPAEFGTPERYRVFMMKTADQCIAIVIRRRDQ